MSNTFEHIHVLIFDLDGTLVDSVPDIAASADIMLQQMGMEACGELAVKHAIGNGIDRLVKRLLTGETAGEPDEALFQQALQLFNEAYAAHLSKYSSLYPDVLETLRQLSDAGLQLCCVTNKAARFSLPLLERLGIRSLFRLVLSGDSLARKKPDPMPLLFAADYLGVPVSACLMVGDSQHDIMAAKAAGMLNVAVPYGYNHGQDIRLAQPDLIIQTLADIPRLLAV